MTLTEKLLARAAGKTTVQAGDNIWVNADVLMTHDVCGPGTIGVFQREFGQDAKVWDKDKIVIIPDHYIFTADSKSNRAQLACSSASLARTQKSGTRIKSSSFPTTTFSPPIPNPTGHNWRVQARVWPGRKSLGQG